MIKFHVAASLKRITDHPIAPEYMAEIVNSYVWDHDRVTAYWLAEEMLVHPRIRELSRGDTWYPHNRDWWRGVWQTLCGIVTPRQKKRLPPTALERQEREREARKARSASLLSVVAIVALALNGCVSDDAEPEPPPTCAEIGAPDSLLCTAGGLCSWEGVECCVAPAPGRPVDAKCEGTVSP